MSVATLLKVDFQRLIFDLSLLSLFFDSVSSSCFSFWSNPFFLMQSQIGSLVFSVDLTKRTEEAICSGTLQDLKQSLILRLRRLTDFLRHRRAESSTSSSSLSSCSPPTSSAVSASVSTSSSQSSQSSKTPLEISRTRFHVMFLTEQVKVVEELISESCGTLEEWAWFKQLKFGRLRAVTSTSRQDGEGVGTEEPDQRATLTARAVGCSKSHIHSTAEHRSPLRGVEYVARMAHCTQVYGFEYQGNHLLEVHSSRLGLQPKLFSSAVQLNGKTSSLTCASCCLLSFSYAECVSLSQPWCFLLVVSSFRLGSGTLPSHPHSYQYRRYPLSSHIAASLPESS